MKAPTELYLLDLAVLNVPTLVAGLVVPGLVVVDSVAAVDLIILGQREIV